MRCKFLFILMISFVFFSCHNEGSADDSRDIKKSEFSIKEFIGSKIGYEKNGKIILTVKTKELVNSFNNYSIKFKLGRRAVSHLVEEIEGKSYLRFFNEDGSVSTVALLKEKNNVSNSNKSAVVPIVHIGSTVCTIEACANCCGCVPNGEYCTACQLDGTDCVRTTSS